MGVSDSLTEMLKNTEFEKGYFVLCYILKNAGFDSQSILIAESLILCTSIIFFCIHNANDRMFVLLTAALTLSEFALSGVRQTIAISIFLAAYKFARERRWYLYILLALLAASFHTSALMVFPFAVLINRKFSRVVIYIYIILLMLAISLMDVIFSLVTQTLDYEQYQLMSFDGGIISFLVSGLFSLVVIYYYKKEQLNYKFQASAHYTILYSIFSGVRFVNIMIMRVLLYFSPFPFLMIDSLSKNKNGNTLKIISLCYVIGYYVYRVTALDDYSFYFD